MRVCLYLEAEKAVAKSGFRRAFESHQQALRLAGVDVVTDPQRSGYEILHLHAFGPKSLYYLKRARENGVKVIVHAHSVGAHDFRDSFTLSNWLAPLYEKYLRFVYEQADAIFTPTPFAQQMLFKMGIEKPVFVVSNGVNLQRFQFSLKAREFYRAKSGLRRFTIFAAGLVIPRKGICDFLQVARKLPQYDFIWFGHRWPRAFAYHPQMERALRDLPPNVRMPGFVENPAEAFCAGDLLLFPSITETQGMVLLEAAALGRPLVVRDLPEYSDWLIDNINGLTGSTADEFAACIERLATDRALHERLASAAQRMAEAHSIQFVGARLKMLYRSVMETDAINETLKVS